MKHRIITISREFGSGGRTIGKSVAQRLHIPCYDQELIETIAEKSGFSQDYIRRTGEDTPRGGWFANALVGRSLSGASNQDYLWSIQRRTILELAQQGPCVIVGRCADAILKDQADCLTVFIHAPLEVRAERIVQRYGETDTAPEKRLREKDRRRAAYYQFYTDLEWGAAKNFHICLDSGALGLDRCVDLIAGLY